MGSRRGARVEIEGGAAAGLVLVERSAHRMALKLPAGRRPACIGPVAFAAAREYARTSAPSNAPAKMIRKFHIKSYKSVLDHTIELGRLNVFIGENGCGKTNILEAMAMVAAGVSSRLDVEDLYARGIRVAKPSVTISSFTGIKPATEIQFTIVSDAGELDLQLAARAESPADVRWFDRISGATGTQQGWGKFMQMATKDALQQSLGDFTIYNLNVLALRGIQNVSRRTPLGINGENLDVALSAMKRPDWKDVIERARCISWLDNILIDTGDELKHQGYKLGRSTSTLYFRDRFMRRRNNVFSAENANEGILHILFYLVLFASDNTPRVFGIDNIETALNPQLCRELVKQLAELARAHDKQALITTHNPAILDGLNLHDDEQRLFVVSRNDAGHTVTERIRVKPEAKEGKLKLSEMWMRGLLGGIPCQHGPSQRRNRSPQEFVDSL